MAKYTRQKQKNEEIKRGNKTAYGRKQWKNIGISKNICLYWIRKYAKMLTPKSHPNGRVEAIEMEELYSFVERKNRIYVINLVSRGKRQIVDYDIAFNKNRERLQ